MRKVRNGDQAAFRVLYDRYKGQLFLYCLRMLNDRDAAMDLLQEIFIRIHSKREQYEPGTNLGGWIHTIARNICLNARRALRDHASFDEQMDYAVTASAQQEDVALRDILTEEIARLPDIYREALILREYEGHSYDEIAKLIGSSMATVKFRIFKAREMLRERLSWKLDDTK